MRNRYFIFFFWVEVAIKLKSRYFKHFYGSEVAKNLKSRYFKANFCREVATNELTSQYQILKFFYSRNIICS